MLRSKLGSVFLLIMSLPVLAQSSTPSAWELNNDPIALEFANKELNYEVLENYILARSEDQGTEKVRVVKLKAGDTRRWVDQKTTFTVDQLAKFARQTFARGLKGIELGRWDMKPGHRAILLYQYQIQGRVEPLVISTYSFTKQGEIFLAVHMAPPAQQRTYQPQVIELVHRLAYQK